MRLRPVSIDQIALGQDGRQYLVTGEAGRIAARIAELDDSLVVNYNERGEFFVVAQVVPLVDDPTQTREIPVLRVQRDDWNDSVLEDLALRAWEMRNGVSAAARLDAHDQSVKDAALYRLEQDAGEAAGPLKRAFQKDHGLGGSPIFIPRAITAAQAA